MQIISLEGDVKIAVLWESITGLLKESLGRRHQLARFAFKALAPEALKIGPSLPQKYMYKSQIMSALWSSRNIFHFQQSAMDKPGGFIC